MLTVSFSSGASRRKKFLPSDDTAESQSCLKRKLINQKKNRASQLHCQYKLCYYRQLEGNSKAWKFIPLSPYNLPHLLIYVCSYLSQSKQSWEEELSQIIYHICRYMPLTITIYHNQSNVERKTFLSSKL